MKSLENLKQKKLFLFDIDGTLAVGDTLYEGSADLLSYIERIGGKAYFITNNSTKSGEDYVTKFRESFGLETTKDQFITSGYMTIRFLCSNYFGCKIFVLGTSSFVTELRKNGLLVTEQYEEGIECIVVAYDSELNYEKLVQSSKALLTTDAPFYATNPDLRCPIDFGFIPDCGAMCAAITLSTGVEPKYLGKPCSETLDMVIERTGYKKEEIAFVGDRIYTDVATGVNNGAVGILVLSGETKKEDIPLFDVRPDGVFASLGDMIPYLQD